MDNNDAESISDINPVSGEPENKAPPVDQGGESEDCTHSEGKGSNQKEILPELSNSSLITNNIPQPHQRNDIIQDYQQGEPEQLIKEEEQVHLCQEDKPIQTHQRAESDHVYQVDILNPSHLKEKTDQTYKMEDQIQSYQRDESGKVYEELEYNNPYLGERQEQLYEPSHAPIRIERHEIYEEDESSKEDRPNLLFKAEKTAHTYHRDSLKFYYKVETDQICQIDQPEQLHQRNDLDQEFQRDRLHRVYNQIESAVDLRTTKQLAPSNKFLNLKSSRTEVGSIAQLLENFYCNDSCRKKNSPHELTALNDISFDKSEYILPDQRRYHETNLVMENHYSKTRQFTETCYPCCEFSVCQNVWSIGTNTDSVVVLTQEAQTVQTDRRDVAVQTDLEPKIFSYSLIKPKETELKFTCPLCQRMYASKNSYGRHLRAHQKNPNGKVITNVRFTTEAKLQVQKRVGNYRPLQERKPIIIQVPRRVRVQCDLCDITFLSLKDKEEHNCIVKPFPMTKCPECPINFYTPGGLNDHVGIAHKKESSYYCIFCDESFSCDSSYNYHLHLNKHLSP